VAVPAPRGLHDHLGARLFPSPDNDLLRTFARGLKENSFSFRSPDVTPFFCFEGQEERAD